MKAVIAVVLFMVTLSWGYYLGFQACSRSVAPVHVQPFGQLPRADVSHQVDEDIGHDGKPVNPRPLDSELFKTNTCSGCLGACEDVDHNGKVVNPHVAGDATDIGAEIMAVNNKAMGK